ncbi:copper chaperone PCu(A)C [Sphingomonas quercus]|uniref:Copper chaperone PCu(A)C n=1 Tax=Sphingomonas quercus TaxID=2842451 RepID=A0ABS6BDZ8_9SPHN|nr:copper chaperone PCu(A)C [Sphingomonas quercus]MBU3076546.1 copper chaperone PCu(A)C [Sphingomonas quercus]
MVRRTLTLMAAFGLAACGGGGGKEVSVTDAEVRLPVVPGRPGAAYFTVTAGGQATRLVSVEGPAATRIELHSNTNVNGHMEMHRLDGVALAAGQKISFAPTGNHAMLFGVPPTLKPGDTTRLTFRFEKGVPVTAEAKVVAGTDAH